MSEDRTRDLPDTRSFEGHLFARLDAIAARFDGIEARFDGMEARLNEIEARFEARLRAIEARFDAVDARFDAVDERLNDLDNRVKAVEAKALDTKPIWENALAEIFAVKHIVEEVKDRVENIERKFDVLTLDMMQLRGDQRRVEKRLDALESRPQ